MAFCCLLRGTEPGYWVRAQGLCSEGLVLDYSISRFASVEREMLTPGIIGLEPQKTVDFALYLNCGLHDF